MNSETDNKSAFLLKLSLSDFPGLASCVVFMNGCNLRCPYCYNGPLAESTEQNLVSTACIKEYLEKRKNLLGGLVLSGGEALAHSATREIAAFAKKLGYRIKLDTNGTLPDALKEIVENPSTCPDYIAMDIKTSPDLMHILSPVQTHAGTILKAIKESITVISGHYPPNACEWRTVLAPPLVSADNIARIAYLLPKSARWFLNDFHPGDCLDSAYNKIAPYTSAQKQAILSIARNWIADTKLGPYHFQNFI